jgi:uncharacterized OB-fold protein
VAPGARSGDRWQAGFWAAVERGEVAVQRCAEGHHQFPGGPACRECGRDAPWVPASGGATVWSWVEFHQRYFEDLEPPYTVVLAQLDEGPRMYLAPDPAVEWTPAIGARIRVEVGDLDGRSLPLAVPVATDKGEA